MEGHKTHCIEPYVTYIYIYKSTRRELLTIRQIYA
jgi:hypothetical protein